MLEEREGFTAAPHRSIAVVRARLAKLTKAAMFSGATGALVRQGFRLEPCLIALFR
jgi:hypothetical protein